MEVAEEQLISQLSLDYYQCYNYYGDNNGKEKNKKRNSTNVIKK